MVGKYLSRALLSVFMDKKARQKLDAMRDGDTKSPSKEQAGTAPQVSAPEPSDPNDPLPETLIRDAISAAERELDRKKNMPAGRRKLIEEALAIQTGKQKLLDDLPKEQREKLTFMAMHAFSDAMAERQEESKRKPPPGPSKRGKS